MQFCVAVAVVVQRDVVCWGCPPLCGPVFVLVSTDDLGFPAEPALERVS